MVVSWSTIQGLTIPYLYVNMANVNYKSPYPQNTGAKNTMLYSGKNFSYHKHNFWFVTVSRVKCKDNILINIPKLRTKQGNTSQDGKNIQLYFFKRVFQPALYYEKNFTIELFID